MLYTEFMQKAADLTITETETGLFYLEPLWHNILYDNKMTLRSFNDVKCGWNDIEDVLKLEVEKRNALASRTPVVMDWLYRAITSEIEPAILEQQTEVVKRMIEERSKKE